MDFNDKQENINKARDAFSKREQNIFANSNGPIKTADKLDDIVLNDSNNIESNDGIQGYVLFAIAIIGVFGATILFMKLLSNDAKPTATNNTPNLEAKLKEEQNKLLKEKLAWEAQKNKEQEKINNKLQSINEIKATPPAPVKEVVKTIEKVKVVEPDVSLEITEYPAVLNKNNTPKKDTSKSDKELKDIFKEVDITQQKTGVIAKTEPKQSPKPKKLTKQQTTKKPTNVAKKANSAPKFYIQIGAFSQNAGKLLVAKIIRQGKYKYFKYPVVVNNVRYTKVLIGPYKSREETENILPQVKKDFAQPKAYILKL